MDGLFDAIAQFLKEAKLTDHYRDPMIDLRNGRQISEETTILSNHLVWLWSVSGDHYRQQAVTALTRRGFLVSEAEACVDRLKSFYRPPSAQELAACINSASIF